MVIAAVGGAETIGNLRLRYQIPDHFNSWSEDPGAEETQEPNYTKSVLEIGLGPSKENSASQQEKLNLIFAQTVPLSLSR